MAKKKSKKTAKKKEEKKEEEKNEEKETISIVNSMLINEVVITEDSDAARDLYNQGRYGEMNENKVQLALHEALYLFEKKKIKITDKGKTPLTYESFLKKTKKTEPNFWTRYCVYKDIRNRGYIIKTALKFGADFRVYDRGVKPGEDHARWVVYPVHESSALTWYEFSAKNRVAHSTRKRLLIGVVDSENDVTFYEVRWIRP